MFVKSIICHKRLLTTALICLLFLITRIGAFAVSGSEVVGILSENLYSTRGNTLDTLESSERFSSPLGEAAADAARFAGNTDIAYLCGAIFYGNLNAGAVTRKDLESAFLDDSLLAVTSVTPKQLKNLLETAGSQLQVDLSEETLLEGSSAEAFPQLSGLRVMYDMSAPKGERVYRMMLDDGTYLDPDDDSTIYSITATEKMFCGAYGLSVLEYETISVNLTDAMASFIQNGLEKGYNSAAKADRVRLAGISEDTIVSHIPVVFIFIFIFTILVCQIFRKKKDRDENDRTVDW